MRRAGNIVADDSGRQGAAENGTGVADALRQIFGIGAHELHMFWGKLVRCFHRSFQIFNQHAVAAFG